MSVATASHTPPDKLIEQLGDTCRSRGLPDLAQRLAALQRWIDDDLTAFEAELAALPRGARAVQRAASHLLDLGGKHLRPMCVALASRLGAGFGPPARKLAIAVELVHSATLLHDDVVDGGEVRRGAASARMVYGNAASIFAGDWLLVQALRQIRAAGVPGLLDAMLDTIDEMILAESVQLERRGRLGGPVADYFRVVEGKTASLFRWAMRAGASAGGLDDGACRALERYGLNLGVAFQAVDDLLDFRGDAARTGKALFADLAEGKATYPLLLALERDPALAAALADEVAGGHGAGTAPPPDPALDIGHGADAGDGERASRLTPRWPDVRLPDTLCRAVVASMERTGAISDCRALARERVARACAALADVPDGPGRQALVTVAEATLYREG